MVSLLASRWLLRWGRRQESDRGVLSVLRERVEEAAKEWRAEEAAKEWRACGRGMMVAARWTAALASFFAVPMVWETERVVRLVQCRVLWVDERGTERRGGASSD